MRSASSHIIGMFDGRPKLQDKIAAALGREAHPTAAGKAVYTMTGASGRQFEWHPLAQRVYYLKPKFDGAGVRTHTLGEVIAFDIITHGDAINAVNIWNRGFAEGAKPTEEKPHLQL